MNEPHSSPSGPLRLATHGRYRVCSPFGGIVAVFTVLPLRVTVTSDASSPVFATTTAKSKIDHTMFGVTVGQKSQPMYVRLSAASWHVFGSAPGLVPPWPASKNESPPLPPLA